MERVKRNYPFIVRFCLHRLMSIGAGIAFGFWVQPAEAETASSTAYYTYQCWEHIDWLGNKTYDQDIGGVFGAGTWADWAGTGNTRSMASFLFPASEYARINGARIDSVTLHCNRSYDPGGICNIDLGGLGFWLPDIEDIQGTYEDLGYVPYLTYGTWSLSGTGWKSKVLERGAAHTLEQLFRTDPATEQFSIRFLSSSTISKFFGDTSGASPYLNVSFTPCIAQNLRATTNLEELILLEWDPPPEGTAGSVSYIVYRMEPDSFEYEPKKTTSETYYEDYDTLANEKYYYHIEVKVTPNRIAPRTTHGAMGIRVLPQAEDPSPKDEAKDQDRDVDLSWVNNGGATNYKVYLSLSPTINAIQDFLDDTPNTYFELPPLEYDRTYYWRIDSECGVAPTREGPVWSFRTQKKPNGVPATPILYSPEDLAQDQSLTPTLQASAFSDPDDDSHSASWWQVDGNGDFSGCAWDSGAAAAATQVQVPSGKLAADAWYYWRVRYQDGRGAWSDWSSSRSFKTRAEPNNVPNTPELASPADGAQDQSLTPTLQASAFSDPDGDSHSASWWQVDGDGDFSGCAWDSGEAAAATQVQVPSGKLAADAWYYWRVRYQDGRGAWSEWSSSRSFKTRADALYVLEYISGDGQTYRGGGMPLPMVFRVKNETTGEFLTSLSSAGLTMFATAAHGYQDNDFNNLNDFGGLGAEGWGGYYYVDSNTGPEYTLSITVYLHLNGTMVDSYPLAMNILGNPPQKAKNPSPSDVADNQDINVDLSWEDGGGATSYNVYFNGQDKGNQQDTIFDPGPLDYGMTYQWRIDAVNGSGTTTGDPWSFTTEQEATGEAFPGRMGSLRILSSGPTRFLDIQPNGLVVWSNTTPGSSGRIQVSSSIVPGWTDTHTFTSAERVMNTQLGGTDSAPAGMVLIPGGTNAGTDPDYGAYSLTASSYYMDKYEVTKALWDEVYNWAIAHGYSFDNAGSGKATNHPVHTVNWYDCVKWCNARSQKEGRPAVYTVNGAVYKGGRSNEVVQTSAAGYRLPTDVEWEYAARGGVASRRFPWGDVDTIQHTLANYFSSSTFSYDISPTQGIHPAYNTGDMPYTSPVGSFAANGYGVHDMAGNLWEWCFAWHPSDAGAILVRGGSWFDRADYCRVGYRYYGYRNFTAYSFGFRAVLPPDQ